MQEKVKTLSVIVPNFNHAEYLPECLDAILAQSVQPAEILVVDDASTDDSCAIVKRYQEKHAHLSLLKLEKNSGGPIIPIQKGLKHVKSDYLALCAADDMIQPGFFEEAMQQLSLHPEAALCFGDYLLLRGDLFKKVSLVPGGQTRLLQPEEVVEACRKSRFHIPSQSCIYKKEAVLEFGGYEEALKGYSDFFLNYQIAFRYPVIYVPHVWAAFRIVENSFGRAHRSDERRLLCRLLTERIESNEDAIRSRWYRSGVLAWGGPSMLLSLMSSPKHWRNFPRTLINFLSIKMRRLLGV